MKADCFDKPAAFFDFVIHFLPLSIFENNPLLVYHKAFEMQ